MNVAVPARNSVYSVLPRSVILKYLSTASITTAVIACLSTKVNVKNSVWHKDRPKGKHKIQTSLRLACTRRRNLAWCCAPSNLAWATCSLDLIKSESIHVQPRLDKEWEYCKRATWFGAIGVQSDTFVSNRFVEHEKKKWLKYWKGTSQYFSLFTHLSYQKHLL